MASHLLNLRTLADENVDDYALVRFEGREAISEPFDYHIEVIVAERPQQLNAEKWIGRLAEFDVTTTDGTVRIFSGCIFDTRVSMHREGCRVNVRIRPGFYRLAFDRGTKFFQDKTTREIFDVFTAGRTWVTTSFSLRDNPPTHRYSTQFDETALNYLSDLLARDGMMYFFRYDKNAMFNHRMVVSNKESEFLTVEGGDRVLVRAGVDAGMIKSLEVQRGAAPGQPRAFGLDANDLDNVWLATANLNFGQLSEATWDSMGNAAASSDDNLFYQRVEAWSQGMAAQSVSGSGDNPMFCAGGRITLANTPFYSEQNLALRVVTHSAYDPWMIEQGGGSQYSNWFEAKAVNSFLQPVPQRHRRTSGPIVGVVHDGTSAAGTVIVDKESRIPVKIEEASFTGNKLNDFVWMPVQQQWAHSTHGAQFFPRIGTRIIVDFLYGNPDLPIVVGTVYTPTQKYPFDPASKSTQSGWRSVSDKNGKIRQEFHFEDKPGKEEIYLYTGRNHRRQIDADDFGTVGHDQTLEVGHDQKETVKNDQKLTVENDRTVKITGVQKTDIDKTRTVTVLQKSLLESKEEIELKVGPCSIKMTMSGIVIEAPQIEIKATATLDVSAGAKAAYKAPMTQVNADATLILKGGMVLIN